MHRGVMLFPTQHPVDIAVVARKSEEFGFDSLWLGEHPIMPVQSAARFPGSPDGVIPAAYSWFVDPFVALARASAVKFITIYGLCYTVSPMKAGTRNGWLTVHRSLLTMRQRKNAE